MKHVMGAWYAGLILACPPIGFLLPDHNTGDQCEGLGWGCVPTPRDSAWLVGLIIGIPSVAMGLAVSLGLYALGYARFRSAVHRHPVMTGTAAAFGGMVAGLVIVLAYLSAR